MWSKIEKQKNRFGDKQYETMLKENHNFNEPSFYDEFIYKCLQKIDGIILSPERNNGWHEVTGGKYNGYAPLRLEKVVSWEEFKEKYEPIAKKEPVTVRLIESNKEESWFTICTWFASDIRKIVNHEQKVWGMFSDGISPPKMVVEEIRHFNPPYVHISDAYGNVLVNNWDDVVETTEYINNKIEEKEDYDSSSLAKVIIENGEKQIWFDGELITKYPYDEQKKEEVAFFKDLLDGI